MASASINVDERLATMIYNQQLQEKQEMNELLEAQSVSNAQAEFRRGLKELVRDHLNTCMALASCSNPDESPGSSNHGHSQIHQHLLNHVGEQCSLCRFRDCIEENDAGVHPHYKEGGRQEDDDELGHRLHRSNNVEGYSTESSAARRRRSRILDRWAARQAQEMMTTMERQTREAELLALAGLQAVSMMDSSFLRETSSSRSQSAAERPRTQASSLVQMWRELEGERRVNYARDGIRCSVARSEDQQPGREGADNRGGENNTDDTNANEIASTAESNEQRQNSEDSSYHSEYRQWELNNATNNEAIEEQNRQEVYRGWEESQLDLQDSHNEQHISRERSPMLGEGEGERVRQIVQRWMPANRMTEDVPNVTHNSERRAVWCSEIEHERVRELSREWVRVTSQQRSVSGNQREQSQRYEIQPGLVRRQARQREAVQGGATDELEETDQDYVNRNALRLRGRQAILDLLMRVARERQRELERLLEHRAVSEFSHRNRIQSLLRGRFLRTGAVSEQQRPISSAAGELGQLRQRRTVSGLREGFHFRAENVVGAQPMNHSDVSEVHRSNGYGNPRPNISGETQLSVHVESQNQSQESNEVASRAFWGRVTMGVNEAQAGNSSTEGSVDLQEVITEGRDGGRQEESTVGPVRDWEENATEGSLENATEGSQENATEEGHHNWRENATEEGHWIWQGEDPPQEVEMEWQGVLEDTDRHWQGGTSHIGRDWEGGSSHDINGDWQGSPSQDIVSGNWQENDSQELVRNLQGPLQRVAWEEHIPTARRTNDFQSLEDATAYNMELRELLGRRSVSTVLASEFRERMDQLILSYVQRQGRAPISWDGQRLATTQDEESGQQEEEGQIGGPINITEGRLFASLPPPPPPPQQQFWRQEMRQVSWTRPPLQRPDMEWEAINDLRSGMERLQQGMTNVQRMLETCMDMQLELQRSVRQEVSAALNRSNGGQGVTEGLIDGSQWVTVRKGVCSICCDKHIDSLLYRCGHMCTCLKCASELLNNSGKCPMCRAPIVEVVRAYCDV